MRRISVTDLDQYAYYLATEEMLVSDLVRRLRHEDPPTLPMLMGRALHKVLERASLGQVIGEGTLMLDGDAKMQERYSFEIDMDFALAPLRELKAEEEFATPVGPVTLVGKVDGLTGTVVDDYKFTSNPDLDRYMESMQWRCYLHMFEAKVFRYHLFHYKEDTKTGVWRVIDYHKLELPTYPRVAHDVQRAVSEFACFLDQINFTKD